MDRFDIPESVRNLLNVTVQARVLDAPEIYCLHSEYGDDWRGLTDHLCDIAFTQRHCHLPDGTSRHAAVARAAEAVWRELAAVKNSAAAA